MSKVLVIGEALVDIVHSIDGQVKNIPGGSPANTAVAMARLGLNSFMKARTSKDKYGQIINNYLLDSKVNLEHVTLVDDPSTLIHAYIQQDGSAKYEANLSGAADFGWTKEELEKNISSDFQFIHLASLTSYVEPGATHVENWFKNLKDSTDFILSFDPNIRHPLDGQPEIEVRNRAKRLASYAHIVKASDEDLKWLEPNKSVEEIANDFIDSGTKLVVVTLGKNGAFAVTQSKRLIKISAPLVTVFDTIGAGDTFSAALLTQLLENEITDQINISQISEITLIKILSNCAEAAAITCSRQGANPPHRFEVSW